MHYLQLIQNKVLSRNLSQLTLAAVHCFESTENHAKHCFKNEWTLCTIKVMRWEKYLAKTEAKEVGNKNVTSKRISLHCACLVFFAKRESLTDLLCHFANRFNSKQNTTKVFVIFLWRVIFIQVSIKPLKNIQICILI